MIELVPTFVGGLLGSAHCIGMCGGFAVAIGAAERRPAPMLARQLLYSAGRITTYAFLGACAGTAGLQFAQHRVAMISAQQLFSLAAGALMLLIGLSVLGVLRVRWLSSGGHGLLAPLCAHFLDARGPLAVFLAGLMTGFLPCGLVYSFLALALASGSMTSGLLLMTAFGLGTVPSMIATGAGGLLLSPLWRARVFRLAACFVILLGGITIRRALPLGADAPPCHTPPAAAAP